MRQIAQTVMVATWALGALSLAACGGESAAPGDDDPGPVDAGTVDGGPDPDPADAGPVDPPPGCGQLQSNVTGISGTEGLVIAEDGTIYYSQSKAIGRLRPGQAPENAWVRLTAGTGNQIWGLALTETHLYVGYPSDRSLWRVDLATGTASRWVPNVGQPNGVIVGADGAVYYSDFAGGEVYRVDTATGEPTQVTAAAPATRFAQPNGLYSVDAQHLLVLAYGAADVWELTLRDGVETARKLVADLDEGDGITLDGITLDGITRDRDGRWYLTDNSGDRVIRRAANFAEPAGDEDVVSDPREPIDRAANLAFGRGALSCDDLYVTSGQKMVRITID